MAKTFPREGSGRRRRPVREPARTLLVICGSQQTERQYLQGLRDHLRNPAVSVVVRGKACSPSQLVRYAKGQRDAGTGDYDEVWCVFDVDEYPDVGEAVTAARRAGIRVAVSHPCFELWLLLHFTDHTAYADTYKQLLPYLRKHVPGYDKSRLRFADYQEGLADAARRARKLEPTGEDHMRNPSTAVWLLTRRMGSPVP